MLTIQNLSFRYRKNSPYVLKGLSLSLDQGQIGVVLGKNGSGKSTLFKTIVGILRPEEGTVSLDGKDVLRMKRHIRASQIAYVPQDITFGSLSVYDSILLGRMSSFGLLDQAEDRAKVEELIEEMGLEDLALKNVNELSGGEKQKVAIARALAQEPKLLVFDEPTGNLDLGNEQLILKEAKRLAKEKGIAILVAIHDINAALSFGDRFFLMKGGSVLREGDKTSVDEAILKEIYGVEISLKEIDGKTIVLAKE